MGMVKVDTHKKEKSLQQKFPLSTPVGVIALLENIHYLREARYRGDIDSATMLLDFMDAYKKANLSAREREVIHYRYEKCLSVNETAATTGLSRQAVREYTKRGSERIASYLAETEGYQDEHDIL